MQKDHRYKFVHQYFKWYGHMV